MPRLKTVYLRADGIAEPYDEKGNGFPAAVDDWVLVFARHLRERVISTRGVRFVVTENGTEKVWQVVQDEGGLRKAPAPKEQKVVSLRSRRSRR